ncbi:MAG: hypothetical protein SGI84_02130 [Gemmatimonadota bacterium]|nr:hypothetical protein [Gemmatimonadota bacterium]
MIPLTNLERMHYVLYRQSGNGNASLNQWGQGRMGTVDWNQGLEFYVAPRREGTNVILLSYPNESHHLARKPNQIDFQIRMREHVDHCLKDTPAPEWMTEGVRFSEGSREVRS